MRSKGIRLGKTSEVVAAAAGRVVAAVVRGGAAGYERRHLSRLIPVGPEIVGDGGLEAGRIIVARLAKALRAERARGRAGHWTYDINRHIGLKQAFAAESRRLRERRIIAALEKQKADAAARRRPSGRT